MKSIAKQNWKERSFFVMILADSYISYIIIMIRRKKRNSVSFIIQKNKYEDLQSAILSHEVREHVN